MSDFRIMGVLNVTPDSFSDGGSYPSVQSAVEAGLRMQDEGASIIDVGGESTRPGSLPTPLDVELHRIIPVVEALISRHVPVSVDTNKAEVAQRSIAAGARMINDVTAFRDPGMAHVCAASGCEVCLMHMQGEPATMQRNPTYRDVFGEVFDFLQKRAIFAEENGIARERIWLDPGVGFGKTDSHNLLLIREIAKLVSLGYPVLLGVSRKGMLGRILAIDGVPAKLRDRAVGGLAVQAYAQLNGVSMIRTHDVKAATELAKTLAAIQG